MALIDTSEKDTPIDYLEARVTALVKRVKELEEELDITKEMLLIAERQLGASLLVNDSNTQVKENNTNKGPYECCKL